MTLTGEVALSTCTANQAATNDYTTATATTSFAVAQGVPALAFNPIPAEVITNPPFAVTATSPSTGAITDSLTPGDTSVGAVSSAGEVTLSGVIRTSLPDSHPGSTSTTQRRRQPPASACSGSPALPFNL